VRQCVLEPSGIDGSGDDVHSIDPKGGDKIEVRNVERWRAIEDRSVLSAYSASVHEGKMLEEACEEDQLLGGCSGSRSSF
jgi:hypothetical protein